MDFEGSIIELQPQLRRFAINLTKDDELANDLVQDTFYKALKYRDKWDASTNLSAWMFTILKNTFINSYRRTKKNCIDNYGDLLLVNTIPLHGVNSPEGECSEKELLTKIDQLKDTYKIPFTMLLSGYKYEEIAETLDVPMGTIKSRIFFARKSLMSSINKQNLTTTSMNDISKNNIRQRLLDALKKEGLTTNEAGGKLRINPTYLSMVKNSGLWLKVPEKDWEALQKWCNSGKGIGEYSKGVPENVASEQLKSHINFTPVTKDSYVGGSEPKDSDETKTHVSVRKEGKTVPDPMKVRAERQASVPRPVKTVPDTTNIVSNFLIDNADKFHLEKNKPEPRRLTTGEMVDVLLKEKASLKEKIDAIDVLLKHYIS